MPPRSAKAEEIWRLLVEEAGEAAIDEAAGVTVAQAEKDLADAGFDVAAERARGERIIASLLSPASRRTKN
jgi:hypothetical protein